jgi:hypothetical protein
LPDRNLAARQGYLVNMLNHNEIMRILETAGTVAEVSVFYCAPQQIGRKSARVFSGSRLHV